MINDLPIEIKLPEGFLEEETRLDYTIPSKMKEVWAVELDLLAKLDGVCKKHNIRYFLDGGNLLGAIRDHHFIPWDDDIDVVMLRPEYDRLMELAEEFSAPYFLQNAFTDQEYTRPHAQLRNKKTSAIVPDEGITVRFNQGIFLDIFPLDGVDLQNLGKEHETIVSYRTPMKYISYHHSGNGLIEFLKKMRAKQYIHKYGTIPQLYSKMEQYIREFRDKEDIGKILFFDDISGLTTLKREWYGDVVPCIFEFLECPIPVGYKEILTAYYGEQYMIPKHNPTTHGTAGSMFFDARHSFEECLEKGLYNNGGAK